MRGDHIRPGSSRAAADALTSMPDRFVDLAPSKAEVMQHAVIKGCEPALVSADLDLADEHAGPPPDEAEDGCNRPGFREPARIGDRREHGVLQFLRRFEDESGRSGKWPSRSRTFACCNRKVAGDPAPRGRSP